MRTPRFLRVAELVRNECASVETIVQAASPRFEWFVGSVAAGTLLTLQLRRRWWDLRPRSVLLNAMLKELSVLVSKADRVIIVGAAIHQGDVILAAQRSHPPAMAGRWEFPGGKVERGESPTSALIRECLEELGVSIVVGTEVGRIELPTGALLMVLRAHLTDDTQPPQAMEHLQLKWCKPDDLTALNWLDSNVGFATLLSLQKDGAAQG